MVICFIFLVDYSLEYNSFFQEIISWTRQSEDVMAMYIVS